MIRFDTLSEFFTHYDKTPRRFIRLDDIDDLKEHLRSTGHSVRENKNGTIIVRTPEELQLAKKRRLALQMREASKYTKLGAAIPIPLAREFSDACKKLGVSQLEVLLPTIDKTIERAKSMEY
ncbi:MAG: hypothetical protein LBH62_01770 [Nitrososphaerota archaeon]|jgi:hypothetical protein|nr:hypothetical protein [Nitrososphaerota archaeon]